MKKTLLILATLVGLVSAQAQISAPNASTTQMTNYTNGMPSDPIFIFCSPNYMGNPVPASLTATPPGGVPGWKFEWFFYNQATNSWNPHSTQNNVPSSTISNLASGGYRVVITDGNNVVQGCFRAWVWHKQTTLNIDSVPPGCEPFNLIGLYNSNNSFTYYNPPPDPFIVNASTQITVCFTANHTYVSDLGFYLVSPGGGTVTLSPNPGANGQGAICNGGNNVNGLCFTTNPAPNFDPCASPAPYTGTYDSFGPGNTPINWAPIYGSDATQGGWRVQIYDCIGADVGALTNATITFTGMASCGPSTITYNSGNINSVINDNSCTPQSASLFTVPPPPPTVAQTINSTTQFSWNASPALAGFPTPLSSSPILSVDPIPEEDTWFYLTAMSSVGCINIDSVFFDYTPPDTPHIAPPPVFCFNGPGDTLSVDVDNGVWSGVGITDTLSGFFDPVVAGPGVHQIIYTAEQPCGERDTVEVTVAEEITFQSQIVNSTCFNADDGSIFILVQTGYAPVTGTWLTTPTQYSLVANNLPPGSHTLILEDGYGCKDTSTHVTTEPTQLALTPGKVDVSCIAGSNGQVTVNPTGGTIPYSYSWNTSPVQNTPTVTNLPAGTYTVTVTDNNGCDEQVSITLNTLTLEPVIQEVITHESCPDVGDGAIDITAIGGTGPFDYLWNTQDTTEDLLNINGGNYTVTLRDIYQCPYSKNFVVTTGSKLQFSYSVSDLLCFDKPTGLISITPLSGNPPYTYFVNGVNWGNSGQLANMSAGTYSILVEDSKGCDSSFVTNISQPPPLFADSTRHQLRLGDHMTLTPSFGGGTGNLALQWYPLHNLDCTDCSQPLAWPIHSTPYQLLITDENGCTVTGQVVVDVYHDGPFIPNAFTPGNKDDLNNLWKISDYGVKDFELQVFDRWGTRLFQSTNIYEGWDGKAGNGKLHELGTYTYKVYVKYIDGTEKTLLGHVTLLR